MCLPAFFQRELQVREIQSEAANARNQIAAQVSVDLIHIRSKRHGNHRNPVQHSLSPADG